MIDKKTRTIAVAAATAALLSLAACGTQPGQPANQGGATQSSYPSSTNNNASYARYGVVQSIDLVQQESTSGIGAGAIVGAVVGGVLGNQVGKGDGRTAATVLGAAGGAYAGNEIQKRNEQSQQPAAVRLNVRLNDGAYVAVTQDTAADIRVGDRVLVQNGVARRY
jgi:outer membrane lipoprotein SlyB